MQTERATNISSRPTPLPKWQLFVLLYLQLAEPMTAATIFPFINQLILEYGIAGGDEKKVGYYAGIVSSLFYLAEMVCVLHWGRLSDRIGRRPVLMMGVIGLTCSMALFGISKTFAALLVSRALSGALNGNAGVIKSMMAEITDESNQAQAFSSMQLVYVGGSSAASFIGGILAHPYERFPGVFGGSEFWEDYPFALPCFVAAGFCFSALILTFLTLKETLGTRCIQGKSNRYGTRSSSQVISPTASTALLPKPMVQQPPSIREVLTPNVRISVLNYGIFALLTVVFLLLQPLFMSTPIAIGGLGFGSPTIGLILGINGIATGAFQFLFFASLDRRYGTRNIFLAAVSSFFIMYLSWPLMNVLARRAGRVDSATIFVLVIQQLFSTLSWTGFSCTQIFITSAAPTRDSLGATNGIAQSFASLLRAFGPAGATSLFAFSLECGALGGNLVYVVLTVLVFLSLFAASWLPKVTKRASDGTAG